MSLNHQPEAGFPGPMVQFKRFVAMQVRLTRCDADWVAGWFIRDLKELGSLKASSVYTPNMSNILQRCPTPWRIVVAHALMLVLGHRGLQTCHKDTFSTRSQMLCHKLLRRYHKRTLSFTKLNLQGGPFAMLGSIGPTQSYPCLKLF